MAQKNSRIIFSLLLILSVPLSIIPLFAVPITNAQTTTAASTPAVCTNPSSSDIAQACADYAAENQVLAKLQSQLTAQKSKSGSLQKNVNVLVSQITATQSKISGEIGTINTLSLQIGQKQKAIGDLNSQLGRENASMSELVTRTDDLDQKGAAYVLLSATSISNFYQDFDDFFSIKQELYATLTYVKQIKTSTQTQEQQLQNQQCIAQ
jgi:peptidoglycan hydrolase CwlO-like protein